MAGVPQADVLPVKANFKSVAEDRLTDEEVIAQMAYVESKSLQMLDI